jgi:hypothetical protein
MVTSLGAESDIIATWDYGVDAVFAFTHPYGSGRVYYTAVQLQQDAYQQAGTALFDGAIKWLMGVDVYEYELIAHCVSDAAGLQAALAAAETNGKDNLIMVMQGTYTGNFVYTSTEGKNITLEGGYTAECASRAVDPALTVLDGNNAGLVLGLYNQNGGDIWVEGFTIRHGNNANGVGGVDTWTTGNITFASNIITNNTSHNAPAGVLAESGSVDADTAGNVTLMDNMITANTAVAGQGGGVAASSHAQGTAGTVTLTNNTVSENTAATGGGAYLSIAGSPAGMVNCYNNIIWNNSAATGGDIYLSKGTGSAHIADNDTADVAGDTWETVAGNIDLDPLFVGTGNYHLQATSPCIDAGLNSAPGIPVNDFEGDARIIGSAPDLGADEYGSAITADTTSQGTIFAGCSLISKYQPSFTWTFTDVFKSFTIYFSISPMDFATKGILIAKANIKGTKSSYIPSSGVWKKIFTAGWNRGNIRPIYWKVVGKRADKSLAESGVRSFSTDYPYYPEIQSPAEGAQLSAATPPTFLFDTNCNIKLRLEISASSSFNPKQTKAFTYSVKDPNDTAHLDKTLSSGQWKSVQKLIGTSTGYFRIIGWDAIKRESVSETRSFTITTP